MDLFYISAVLLLVQRTSAAILPTIYWDSRNLFFSCKDPTIRVRWEDKVNIFCPNQNTQSYLKPFNSAQPTIYEKFYYVKTEQEYNSCDATNGYARLTCDGTKAQDRTCRDTGNDCNAFRTEVFSHKSSPKAIDYRKGGTYYFIGTSFRSVGNHNNRQGGSCNTTLPGGYDFKMRFKVYICTDEEEARGECDQCRSDGCYYKDCISDCSAWKLNKTQIFQNPDGKCFAKEQQTCNIIALGSSIKKSKDVEIPCPLDTCERWAPKTDTLKLNTEGTACSQVEERNCKTFNGRKYTETKTIDVPCPKVSCSDYTVETEKKYKINGTCFSPRRRTCTRLGREILEYSEEVVVCPPTAEPTIKSDDTDNRLYIYIAIGATVFAFIIGIVIGLSCMKYHYNKKFEKETSVIVQGLKPAMTSDYAFINKAFPSVSESESRPQSFHFGETAVTPADVESQSAIVPPTAPPMYPSIPVGKGKPVKLGRSVSFQYADENVFNGPAEIIMYRTHRPRRPNKTRVNRHSSATSRTTLVRNISNASDARLSSLSSGDSNPGSREPSLKSITPPLRNGTPPSRTASPPLKVTEEV